PSSPPMIYSSVAGIKHPNLNGNWICCDLLKEQEELEKGYTGGYVRLCSTLGPFMTHRRFRYTPALTLRGLFLQFLTFFSSTKVDQADGRVVYIGDYLLVQYELDAVLPTSQEQLEQLWHLSSSPEHIVDGSRPSTHTVEEGFSHKVKNITLPLRRIETVNPRWHSTYKLISKWQCKRCPYGSPALPVHRSTEGAPLITSSILPQRPPPCLLEILNDDILLELSKHLLSESLVSFSVAYPRFRRLVTTTHILLERELRCFFLRNPLRTSVLGIGIALDPTSRKLSSDFDWLSLEAFDTYGVRTSIQKRDFQFFLPLAFNRHHFERVEEHIWSHLATLDSAIRNAEKEFWNGGKPKYPRRMDPPKHQHETVGVVVKLMNNIVVALMQACDHVLEEPTGNQTSMVTLLHASEKAVTAYGHLFHLLLCLSRTTPLILEEAFDRLRLFIQVPKSRYKSSVPDLGELIVLITLVLAHPRAGNNPISWTTINGPFLEEAIVRNVRWVLKGHPVLEAMESGTSSYRLYHTFQASKTSLRLIMFQMAFLDTFVNTYSTRLSRLDDNYGFPDPDIPARMVEEVKAIYRVDTWTGFFHRVQYARGIALSQEDFSRMLRNAVNTSAKRKYHIPKRPRDMHLLWRDREELERKWLKSRSQ
ncbi:hypothetical protein H0H81_001943, partial [Sphagnurus paluster]